MLPNEAEPARSHVLVRFATAQWRLLTFQQAPIASDERRAFLACALLATWLAGIGRYWDHPHAQSWQYFGLGSLVYAFLMAALLHLVVLPLQPRGWSYQSVLLFVAMTAPLAWLYAVPIERFVPIERALSINAWVLGIVATWRVALLLRQLVVVAGLGFASALIAGLLPLCAIVSALAMLNLEHAIFDLMAMPGERPATPNDAAYAVVVVLTYVSFFAIVPLLIAYAVTIVVRRRAHHRQRLRAFGASRP